MKLRPTQTITLAVLKGILEVILNQPVNYINAPTWPKSAGLLSRRQLARLILITPTSLPAGPSGRAAATPLPERFLITTNPYCSI